MRIHNIRMGLATNSSSTHSIILMKQADHEKAHTDEYYDFGWNNFTAADRESRENYLGYTLRSTLDDMVGLSNANVILDGLFPHRQNFSKHLMDDGYGIDHQSLMSVPVNWDGKGVDLEFFRAMKDYVLNNPIAILGGNDNDQTVHPLDGMGRGVDLGLPKDSGFQDGLVARNDGTHWVVFNRSTGAKVRLSFEPQSRPLTGAEFHYGREPLQEPVAKGLTPELVDIKITDFCPIGCTYCYQNSTVAGKHADISTLRSLAYVLAEMKVFEVALGGGEPTMHPDFLEILKMFRRHGIVPNFTTKSLKWTQDEDYQEILDLCGAFAYSVNTVADVRRIGKLQHGYQEKHNSGREYDSDKFSVQYVLGTGGNLYNLLEEARKYWLRVTLLGFKHIGRGVDFKEKLQEWIPVVKKLRKEGNCVHLGVDTAIIAHDAENIKRELGVEECLMTAEEGKFSMYIDAVDGRMGPSSYCDESLYVPMYGKDNVVVGRGVTRAAIEDAFRGW